MIPFYTLNHIQMTLPYLQRLLGSFDAPKIYFRLTRRRQLCIVLPCYVKYGPRLLEQVEWLLLDVRRVPYEYVGLVAAGCYQSVGFIPA